MEQVDSSTELHLNRKDLAALAEDVVKEEVILESSSHHHHHHHHQVRKRSNKRLRKEPIWFWIFHSLLLWRGGFGSGLCVWFRFYLLNPKPNLARKPLRFALRSCGKWVVGGWARWPGGGATCALRNAPCDPLGHRHSPLAFSPPSTPNLPPPSRSPPPPTAFVAHKCCVYRFSFFPCCVVYLHSNFHSRFLCKSH